MLFFHRPEEVELFKRNSKNYYSCITPETYEALFYNNILELHFRRLFYLYLKINIDFLFNGGFVLLNSNTINIKTLIRIEEAVSLFYSIDYVHTSYADETLTSIFFEKDKSNVLSSQRYTNLVYISEYKKSLPIQYCCIHFISITKIIFMYQAVKIAVRSHFFRENSSSQTS